MEDFHTNGTAAHYTSAIGTVLDEHEFSHTPHDSGVENESAVYQRARKRSGYISPRGKIKRWCKQAQSMLARPISSDANLGAKLFQRCISSRDTFQHYA